MLRASFMSITNRLQQANENGDLKLLNEVDTHFHRSDNLKFLG